MKRKDPLPAVLAVGGSFARSSRSSGSTTRFPDSMPTFDRPAVPRADPAILAAGRLADGEPAAYH